MATNLVFPKVSVKQVARRQRLRAGRRESPLFGGQVTVNRRSRHRKKFLILNPESERGSFLCPQLNDDLSGLSRLHPGNRKDREGTGQAPGACQNRLCTK